MKAYVLHGVNKLQYEETPKPNCPDGWAIVRVKAAGICSSDIPRIFTNGTYHFPTIPGHEFSGIVDTVASVTDMGLVGKHVGIFPLIPCRKCSQCKNGHYEICEHYDYIGSRRDGGFAEYVAVPVWNLMPLPENLSFTSSAMLEPLAVALHAAKIANIQKGQSVGVIGTGMIGICVAQWAKLLGAVRATVIGRNESKREIAEKCGLDYIVPQKQDDDSLYDVVVEAVGSPKSIDTAIQSVNPGGVLVLMGNPSGDICLPKNTYWRILRKQLVVKGTWNSSYDGNNQSDWNEAVEALKNNKIHVEALISHQFTQNHLKDGLQLMLEHKEPYCKVMTVWND